jgi:hypothetical protein
MSSAAIAEYLNQNGIKTPTGLSYSSKLVWVTYDKYKKYKKRKVSRHMVLGEPFFVTNKKKYESQNKVV